MAACLGGRSSERRDRAHSATRGRGRHYRRIARIPVQSHRASAEGVLALMQAGVPKVSAELEKRINQGLLDRLPVTFSAYWFEQFRDWDLLFPAEKDYYERLFSLLDRSDRAAVDRLFAPLRQIELRMGVNEKTWPRREFTLDQVDFLNRNPQYPKWRAAVSDIFKQIDPALDEEVDRVGRPRLAIVISPSEL